MVDDDGGNRESVEGAAIAAPDQTLDGPVTVFADTMPAPVPSVADGHPVELGAPLPPRPRWWDRVLGAVLGKAVAAMNPDGDRMAP